MGWALLFAATGAAAQAQAPASSSSSLDEIVVTGIRHSQISALKVKRANEDIVEAISAEDIGKLPDDSIADSIARLPGLAAQRDNSGRTQDISIDGLPSAMNTTLLNGFMQATTDNNRTTQLDQYPAEIMNSVVVYKTGDASLTGAAIGTIDMRTVRPLDYGKTNLFLGAQGEYALEGKLQPGATDTGYRANLTYITQLDNDKIGVMFGYSHIETPNQIIAQHPWGYYAANDQLEGGLQDQLRSDTLTRDSGVVTIQYKPTDNLEFVVDAFDSSYDDDAIIRGVEFPLSGTPTNVANGTSTWSALAPQLESYDYRQTSRLRSADFTMNYKFGNGWKMHADYGYSDADNHFDQLQLYNGFGLNGQQNTTTATLTEGKGPGGNIGISNWSENLVNVALGENQGWSNYIPAGFPGACPGGVVSPNNPPQWGSTCNGGPDADQMGGAGQNLIQRTFDSIQQTKWSLSKDIPGSISNIEAGVSYSVRKKDYRVEEDELFLLSGNESQPIPASWLSSPTNMSVFGLPDMYSINPRQAFNSGQYGSVADYRAPGGGNGASLSDWSISERVITPYFKAQIRTEVGGHDLTGNFGIQAVNTSQSVTTSFEYPAGGTVFNYVAIPSSTEYWDVLPSLNLTLHLNDSQDIRFSAGRSMARARFDQMGGGSSVSFNFAASGNTSPWSGSLANPSLKPWISDDVELTYERYFAPGEGISLDFFYKNLETYIYQSSSTANFSAYYAATGPYTNNGVTIPAPIMTGPVTQWVNGNGGALYGVIFSGNFQLKHLSQVLDGFGISGTAGVIESTVKIPTAPGCALNNINTYQTPCQSGTPDGNLPQYSKYVANVSLYWEKNGISLRLNDRYRSKYDQEVVDYNGGLQPVLGAAENIVDFQAGYDITSGPLKNLSFTFAAENITNEAMNSYTGRWNSATNSATSPDPKNTVYYKLFGTNLLFGVHYKY
ncbi:TonB-dependent receptor [Phenylobacterium montanum]|uniref:TonB-dependent receptor n=1 Tax=Phenylobacterium montanum TaxID=2823693 RepID=A0A975G2M1_9CAUL|nr:TonB-dependent receptor [Caulobacter sp. S6]QUD89408.1 TonB-dependent receptor [Caulobacter sp. S6]